MRISFVVLFCVFLSCSLPPADYSSPEGDEVGIAIIAPCEIFTGEHAEAKVVALHCEGLLITACRTRSLFRVELLQVQIVSRAPHVEALSHLLAMAHPYYCVETFP